MAIQFVIIDDGNGIRVSARNEDVEVGYLKLDSKGVVRDACVQSDWRRQGIATDMVRFAIKEGLKPKYNPARERTLEGSMWVGKLPKKLPEGKN